MILFWISTSFGGFAYQFRGIYGTLLVSLSIFLICLRWIRTALWARLAATAAVLPFVDHSVAWAALLIALMFSDSTGEYHSPPPTVRTPIAFFIASFFLALLPIVLCIGLLYIIWKRLRSDLSLYQKRRAEKGTLITLKLSAR